MSKHTQEPWKVRQNGNDCFVEGNEVVGKTFAGEYHREIMGDEQYPSKLADAHLVAAAPDLLTALEAMCVCHYGRSYAIREVDPEISVEAVLIQARAAIIKAKAE
jgi:hypothetical protein